MWYTTDYWIWYMRKVLTKFWRATWQIVWCGHAQIYYLDWLWNFDVLHARVVPAQIIWMILDQYWRATCPIILIDTCANYLCGTWPKFLTCYMPGWCMRKLLYVVHDQMEFWRAAWPIGTSANYLMWYLTKYWRATCPKGTCANYFIWYFDPILTCYMPEWYMRKLFYMVLWPNFDVLHARVVHVQIICLVLDQILTCWEGLTQLFLTCYMTVWLVMCKLYYVVFDQVILWPTTLVIEFFRSWAGWWFLRQHLLSNLLELGDDSSDNTCYRIFWSWVMIHPTTPVIESSGAGWWFVRQHLLSNLLELGDDSDTCYRIFGRWMMIYLTTPVIIFPGTGGIFPKLDDDSDNTCYQIFRQWMMRRVTQVFVRKYFRWCNPCITTVSEIKPCIHILSPVNNPSLIC